MPGAKMGRLPRSKELAVGSLVIMLLPSLPLELELMLALELVPVLALMGAVAMGLGFGFGLRELAALLLLLLLFKAPFSILVCDMRKDRNSFTKGSLVAPMSPFWSKYSEITSRASLLLDAVTFLTSGFRGFRSGLLALAGLAMMS